MTILEEKIKKFRSEQFKKKYRDENLSIKDEKHREYAIRKAYADMMPRTIKNLPECKEHKICQEKKEEIFSWLNKEFEIFINSPSENFQEWHEKICDEFIERFNKNALVNKKDIEFGKAQKIINMTFKYLRCFDDAAEHRNVFANCHMAIDSYIIDWYNREYPSKKITAYWSNLKKKEYYEIQKNIKGRTKNPFEDEFFIWDKEKMNRKSEK